jgi:hypothetical protein
LVQCRKKGAANYGNKSEGVAEGESGMFSKVMGHETTPEAARQIQQQGFKKSHTGIFFNVGNQNYSGGGYGGTVVMAKVSGPIDDILNLEDDNDLPDNLDDFADGEEIANYAREEGYWAWTDGVQFAVLDPRHIQVVKQGVAEEQELDEKWSQKYKSSINCANPKGFSQRAHCAGRNKNEDVEETRRGQVPMTLKAGETDNLEPENIAAFRQLPAYKQGQAAQQKAGKQLIQQSPFTFQSDQDWAYRQGAFDTQQAAMFANFGGTKPLTTAEGEQQKGADYRDPKEVNYDDEYDAMVARVKRLAGLGPMRTVYDPNRRVYRNMPTAVQPKK